MKKTFLFCLVLLFVKCTEKVAGTTDETITGTQAKAMVSGKLFEPDGKTPAKAATVSMRKKSVLADTSHDASNPQPFTSASVTTDRNGTFAIDTIDTGTYIIEGSDGANNVVLIDSIKVKNPDSTKNLGADTLLPAGVVKGVIKLTEGGDPRKVFVLAFGLDRFALPDANGNFTFPMLAKGKYSLRFLPSLENYGVLDTAGVSVKSADTTNLDTIVLPFKGIPSPKNLVISYDTLKQTVILNWVKADTSLISGYNIYRSDNKQNFQRISQTPMPKTTTVYYDSNVIVGGVYEYRAVSLNASGNESPMGGTPGDTVKIISSTQVTTIMTWAIKNTVSDTASINDTVKFILNFQNPTRKISQVRWFVNRKDSVIRQSVDSSLTGKDSLSYFWNKAGEYKVYVNVVDAGGTVWADSDSVYIIQDVPQVKIVGDSAVAINTPITFISKVSQKFGYIVKYQWDNGIVPGAYIIGDSNYTVRYLKEGHYTVTVLVTDDDGNTNSNTHGVIVTNDAPTITGLKDTTISIKDTVLFFVSALDTNGILQKYYWNFGDGSAKQFDTTKSPSDFHVFPSIAMQCTVSVAVADSFGKLASRKVLVTVLLDVPVPNAGKDTTVSIKDTVRLHGSATQQFGTITEWAWDIGNTGTFKVTSKSDTAIIAPPSENLNYLCILRVTDDVGNVGKDTVKVTILQDVPVPNAGKDTTVSIKDTILLHGSATQQFGTITEWAWDLGNTGTFKITSKGDTSIIAPAAENLNYPCILRVTDDDGNIAKDTMKVTVLQDVPIVNIGNDTIIPTNDTIILHGNAKQQYGTIVKWEWKFGSGNWNTTVGSDAIFIAPSTEQTVLCSLVVTDDDGNIGVNEVKIGTFIKCKSTANGFSGGYQHSMIIKTDGTLWACGNNDYGQLGDGTNVQRHSLEQVINNVQSVSASHLWYSLILKNDGTLLGCGDNGVYQLGDGTTTNRSTPVQIMTNVKNMVASSTHSLILKTDGTLWACGDNPYGELGDGTNTPRPLPVQVMTNVQCMAVGEHHSLIVKNDGTLWSCGLNDYGQLGDGTTEIRTLPIQIMSDVNNVAAGQSFSLILKIDGTLLACGADDYSQLGDGATQNHGTPIQVMANVKAIAAGWYHSLILKREGTLLAYGWNSNGQLGAAGMTNVKSIAAGTMHTIILKTDGTLWACGLNDCGQLGDGTTTDRSTPIRIIPPQ
jgi:alpha-tubulin suppressor-like RCC1 family protein